MSKHDESKRTKKSGKAGAQVGTWVVPKSSTGEAGDEGLRPVKPDKKSKKRKRPPPISIRPTAVQRAIIANNAKAAEMSRNKYVLMKSCGAEHVPIKPSKEDRVERAAALRNLRTTGNLLNQIAKHLNSGCVVGSFDIGARIDRHEKNIAKVMATFFKCMPDEE